MTSQNSKQSRYIKCKFCDWQTLKFYTSKSGKIRSGYRNLINHIEIHHEDEYKEIIDRLDNELAIADCSKIKRT